MIIGKYKFAVVTGRDPEAMPWSKMGVEVSLSLQHNLRLNIYVCIYIYIY